MESFPLCFYTSEEFEAWAELGENESPFPDPRLSFCHYCTKDYQKEMTQRGRCESPDLDLDQFNDDHQQLELL